MEFNPKRVRQWRRKIWRIFTADGFKPHEMNAVMVMAAVDAVGTNPALVSELVGVSEEYVAKVLRRLRKQRILQGQTLRVGWDAPGFEGQMAAMLDAMVSTGELTRPPDPKRSAAQKARAPETRARGSRQKRTTVAAGAFTPQRVKSNPLYGLAEWEGDNRRRGDCVGRGVDRTSNSDEHEP